MIPDGKDPDEFIRENGKEFFIKLLEKKEIIQDFLWNYYLSKIDKNNPFEISKFEKEIKKLSYSIRDETLKKYVLEDFLEKLNRLTPNQAYNKKKSFFNFKSKKNFQILKETKILHQKRKNLSKSQVIEFSILFLILNYFNISSKRLDELSQIEFVSKKK